MQNSPESKNYKKGMICQLSCMIMWGLMPIYWQALKPIGSEVIILYRIVLVGVCCFAAALATYGLSGILAPLKVKGAALKYFLAGLVITFNWSLYIWAVNSGKVIQTCIGYYMEPLVICVFGVIIFKEKLTGYKLVSCILACIGLLVLLIYFHQLPFVALGLCLSFAIYTAIKKTVEVPAVLSLLYETLFLVPVALVAIIYLELTGSGATASLGDGEAYKFWLLLLCGIMTAVPMGLFSAAAQKLPMITMGITEYIAPSIALLVGIFVLKEPFDMIQLISFIIIWIGLVIFTRGEYLENKREGH